MLKVDLEPEEGFAYERCCFCRDPTKYWYTKKDVAVCPKCATHAMDNDVPAKRTWITRERIAGGESKIVPGEQHIEVEEKERWEYCAEVLHGDSWDKLGRDGWEMVNAVEMREQDRSMGYFRRRLR